MFYFFGSENWIRIKKLLPNEILIRGYNPSNFFIKILNFLNDLITENKLDSLSSYFILYLIIISK